MMKALASGHSISLYGISNTLENTLIEIVMKSTAKILLELYKTGLLARVKTRPYNKKVVTTLATIVLTTIATIVVTTVAT
jgi:hypothetical protein